MSSSASGAEAVNRRRGWRVVIVGTLVAAVLLVVVLVSINSPSRHLSSKGWRLDLDQSFSSLPSSVWNVENGTFAANESSYLLARNVSTNSGILRIQGKHESAGGRYYTSGRLNTDGKYALPNYFRAEVRAKVPWQAGMWAAPLWLRPTNGRLGEIDVVETYGAERHDPQVHESIHGDYSEPQQLATVARPFSDFTKRADTAWHTYVVEKTPGHIKMWVDGAQTADFSKASAPWFDRYFEAGLRWNLRVNLQIGGAYGLPDSTTQWDHGGTVMQVDYIKTWIPR